MSNLEVQKQQNKGLQAYSEDTWGTEGVESGDIRIPKLLLMQGISGLVAEEKASAGDIVNSVTGEVLGSSKKPVAIVPIYMWKDFTIMEEIEGKFEFKERVPYTPETAHWRDFENRDYEEGGVRMRRDFGMNFLVMLADDLQEDKIEGALPYALTFKRTSLNAGKDLATYFTKAAMKKKPACFFTLDIGAKMEKGDKGPYYVSKVVTVKETPDFGRVEPVLKNWYLTFKAGAAKIDESDLQSDAAEATQGSSEEYSGKF